MLCCCTSRDGRVCSPSGRWVATRARVFLTPRWLPQAKDASQVAPELSAVVVYCQAVPFPGLARALRHPRPCQVSSFSERKARKLIKEAGERDRARVASRPRSHRAVGRGRRMGAVTQRLRGWWAGTCCPSSALVGLGSGVGLWGQRPGWSSGVPGSGAGVWDVASRSWVRSGVGGWD